MTNDKTETTPADPMAAHIADCRAQGFPFCDTCDLPAVWSEFYGWMHSTPEHKFGVPKHFDESGHEVTAKKWWTDSPSWSDRAPSASAGEGR